MNFSVTFHCKLFWRVSAGLEGSAGSFPKNFQVELVKGLTTPFRHGCRDSHG
jgi:hypothetical protein